MPALNTVHIERSLNDFNINVGNKGSTIFREACPIRKVMKSADKYYIYTQGDWLRVPDTAIGVKGEINESTFTLSNTSYNCEGYGQADYLAQEVIDQADEGLEPWIATNDYLNQVLDNKQEADVASLLFTVGNYAAGYYEALTSTRRWDSTASTPLTDIQKAIDTIDKEANLIIMGPKVWRYFAALSDVQQAVNKNYQQYGIVTPAEAARIWGIPILVGKMRYNSANEGQTVVKSNIWGNHCAVLHVEQNPGLKSATFATTFQATERKTAITYRKDLGKSGAYHIKVTGDADYKITAQSCGYLIQNCTS